MNDDELLARIKAPLGGVRMTTPLDAVTGHGRAVRHGRRLRGLTGVVALAGSVAAAAVLLVPGTARPAQTGTVRLAAWTVARDPDGGITVTFNQMKDLAQMQATLRADGIPARVTFNAANATSDPLPLGCTAPHMSSAANIGLQAKILTPPAVYAYRQRVHAEDPAPGKLAGAPAQNAKGHARSITVKDGSTVYILSPGAQGRRVVAIGRILPPWLQKIMTQETDNPNGSSALYIYPPAIPTGIGLYIGVDLQSPNNFSFGEDLVVTSPRCTGS
jgi:hypothetical protein